MNVILLFVIRVGDNQRPSTNHSEEYKKGLPLSTADFHFSVKVRRYLTKEISINVPICLIKILSYTSDIFFNILIGL